MTVFQNVMVGSVYGHVHRNKDARKRAQEALELVELSEKKDILTAHITFRTGVFWKWQGPGLYAGGDPAR